MTSSNGIADDSGSDFMVVARPTEPMSLTYRILYSPEQEMWTLTQSVRVWVPSRQSWDIEELVEIRYWSLPKLVATLVQWIHDCDGYFEVAGADALQAAVDRMTNR